MCIDVYTSQCNTELGIHIHVNILNIVIYCHIHTLCPVSIPVTPAFKLLQSVILTTSRFSYIRDALRNAAVVINRRTFPVWPGGGLLGFVDFVDRVVIPPTAAAISSKYVN